MASRRYLLKTFQFIVDFVLCKVRAHGALFVSKWTEPLVAFRYNRGSFSPDVPTQRVQAVVESPTKLANAGVVQYTEAVWPATRCNRHLSLVRGMKRQFNAGMRGREGRVGLLRVENQYRWVSPFIPLGFFFLFVLRYEFLQIFLLAHARLLPEEKIADSTDS